MKREERISAIQEQLLMHGRVEVEELKERFQVSSVTIRSDLNELERKGGVRRVYGGAELGRAGGKVFIPRPLLKQDITRFSAGKIHIAKLARECIREGEWIFLGCGDTCAAIGQALNGLKINAVTNSLVSASVMMTSDQANVIVTGGVLSGYDRHFLSEELFEKSLSGLHVAKAFFGASGLDAKAGFTGTSLGERSVFEAVCRIAEEVYFVMESGRFGSTSFVKIASLDQVDCVVTSADPGEEYGSLLRECNIRCLY